MKKPTTPQLDRISAVNDQTQPAGAFIDWLAHDKGIHLAVWLEDADEDFSGLVYASEGLTDLLAEWKGVDRKAAELEKMALLEYVGTFNKQANSQ